MTTLRQITRRANLSKSGMNTAACTEAEPVRKSELRQKSQVSVRDGSTAADDIYIGI